MKKIFFVFLLLSSLLNAQELITVLLPPPQKEIGKPLMQALTLRQSSRAFDTKPLPLQELSNLLWAAYGVNRPQTGKRTAPSARNWQEIDIYVALDNGVYLYEAKEHMLSPIASGDLRSLFGTQDFVKTAPVNLLYVSDYAKIKSNDNDEIKLMWTSAGTGFIAQNVYLYCASQNLGCVVRGLIEKSKLAAALKLRENQKIILSQTVGYVK
ncbi:MAG: SagB/ThcOx family dehydrogenase [Melioribacteraceae bacterium]